MQNPKNSRFSAQIAGFSFLFTAAFSLSALVATFFISNSNLHFETKTAIFLSIALFYLFFCASFYVWQKGRLSAMQTEQASLLFDSEIEGKLFALEEANEFFGASLKPADMFRLVASRINEIVRFSSCVLFLPAGERNFLQIKYAFGENSQKFIEFQSDINRSLAAKVFLSQKAQLDPELLFDKKVFSEEILKGLRTAAAVPLGNRGETFGVLVLYGGAEINFDEIALGLLEAVATRVAPLFASSFAFERSLSNALTDSLTNLPNERGFFLVLENQLAEAHRYRDERPLTVLSIDIRDFAELNQKYGHATGDRLLSFASTAIKKQLRQMDVLSRSSGDEFLAVLPTAGEKISQDVTERIKRAFILNPFEISAQEKIHLELNFGAATFWRDGETAEALLKTARLRKQQDKSTERNRVLWFPKEFVN